MTSTLPAIAVGLIEEYASMKFETKQYKLMKNAHKCRITKVKYKCYLCGELKNKKEMKKYADYECKKNHFVGIVGNEADNIYMKNRNMIMKNRNMINSIYYTNKYGYFPYGQNWEVCSQRRKVMRELIRKHCQCGKCFHCKRRSRQT